jgi:hypothetical protein
MTASWRFAGAATEAHQIEANEALAAISVGSNNWSTTQIAVSDTATLICPYRAGRRAVTITALSASAVYLGGDDSVSIASGVPLAGVIGATKTIETCAAIWGVTADSATVSVEELF